MRVRREIKFKKLEKFEKFKFLNFQIFLRSIEGLPPQGSKFTFVHFFGLFELWAPKGSDTRKHSNV